MKCQLAIVGLGTAGAAAAAAAAGRGIDVIAVDSRPLEQTGASWLNGVPAWAFDMAGFERPVAPELRGTESRFHLLGGWGPERVRLEGPLEVDMRALTERLQLLAEGHGARLIGQTRVTGFDASGLDTTAGRIDAEVILDASGLTGINLLRHPSVARADLCVASQSVHAIASPEGAKAFVKDHGGELGDVICFSGVAGGYSIVNVRVEHDLETVSLLTGSIPASGVPGGVELNRRFREEHPWIGDTLSGGSRAIPLHRPWTRIARGRFASIGDAAGMVHSAHGSGIAMQMLAARLLADTLADGGNPWDYNVAWQRKWGGLLAGADLQRRFVQHLQPRTLRAMMRRGVMTPAMLQAPLQQRPPRPPPAALLRALPGLATMPRSVRAMVPTLARGEALMLHYRGYPSDPAKLATWSRRLARISGTVD
ncbi:MAG: hypothetical protein KC912_02910 [Proteobacteria bacterium]|nr:hypothetical protein [Pseudomonadota bacterium]